MKKLEKVACETISIIFKQYAKPLEGISFWFLTRNACKTARGWMIRIHIDIPKTFLSEKKRDMYYKAGFFMVFFSAIQ